MVTVKETRMKCNDCGYKYSATKKEGGFWNRLSYSPSRCPKCGSKFVSENAGGFWDTVGDLLGL
jgi:predicted Zn-ribbon and HTH transcriptional regulator